MYCWWISRDDDRVRTGGAPSRQNQNDITLTSVIAN